MDINSFYKFFDAWRKTVSEQLEEVNDSIAGVTLNVVNPTDRFSARFIDDNNDPKYYGFEDKDGYWFIIRITTDNTIEYSVITNVSTIDSSWAGRDGLTYGTFRDAI